MIHRAQYLIKEIHTDLFGHVNNATYLELFEEARWDLIVRNGFGIPEIRKLGVGPVILECNLKFLREIHPREEVTITVEPLEYTGKVGKLRQQILKTNGEVSCDAIFTFGLFDLKNRKLIEPTAEWKRAIGMSNN